MADPIQSTDDMMRLLRESLENGGEAESEAESASPRNRVLSDKQLHNALKKMYFGSGISADAEEESEYTLDDDFLREVNASAQKGETPPVSEEVVIYEENAVPDKSDPTPQELVPTEDSNAEADDDIAPWEASVSEIEADQEDASDDDLEFSEVIADDALEYDDEKEFFESTEAMVPDTLNALEDAEEDTEEEIDEERLTEAFEDDFPMSSEEEPEPLYDDLPVIEEPEMTPLILETIGESEEVQEEAKGAEEAEHPQIDASMVDLLVQFGCHDEIEENVSDEDLADYLAEEGCDVPYDFALSYAEPEDEYVTAEQNFEIDRKYQRKFVHSLGKLIACSFLTFLVFLYDFLPLLNIEFSGLFDYLTHHVAYILFGLQLLVVSALPAFRGLWHSIRALLKLKFTIYTAPLCAIVAVALHDISLLGSPGGSLPSVFHFVAALMLLAAVIADHLLLCREKCTFRVYGASQESFTLLKSEGKGSVAEKLYRGGVTESQCIRGFAPVSFPNRFFRAICETEESPSILRWLFVPVTVLSLICGVICMALGQDVFASITAVFILLLSSLPAFSTLVDAIVLYVAALRLSKKKAAIAGTAAISRYAATNVMVFCDTHLFSKCTSSDVGIVFYDKNQSAATLCALRALYGEIGGPMADIFGSLPEGSEPSTVKILRLCRNGVEAVIARSQLLIVGDHAFMERYGLQYPKEEKPSPKRQTLCVSLNGKMTAKINVRYAIEPLFEVIVERLAEHKIFCAVETCDPLIHSKLVSALREHGHTPISIVHKTAKEHHASTKSTSSTDIRKEPTGILAQKSRLRLAELLIWCKRLSLIRRRLLWAFLAVSTVSLILMAAFMLSGMRDLSNQYLLLLIQGGVAALLLAIALLYLPKKHHISLSSFEKNQKKKQKKERRPNS